MSVTTTIRRLRQIRADYFPSASAQKLQLLDQIGGRTIRSSPLLKQIHDTLCFLKAFPDNRHVHHLAVTHLDSFEKRLEFLSKRQLKGLDDSGISGTTIHYEFSHEIADWLSARAPQQVEIDWRDYERPHRLESMLAQMALPAEHETFDSGATSPRQWIQLAKGSAPLTDLTWLLRHVRERLADPALRTLLYDAAEVPLVWDLANSNDARTQNAYPIPKPVFRVRGLRSAPRHPKREMVKPLRGIRRLPRLQAAAMIDVVRAALAGRHREVYAMNHANVDEVYLANVGFGTQVTVLGVTLNKRFSLEGNYGYMILSNGVPIGYGGATAMFQQANTGINVFDEYRGSEAAFLFVQTLRVFRTLFACDRFVVNAYQFGGGNREAINSGAFWFYYKLGFRPVDPKIRRLAAREFTRIKRNPRYRSSPASLRQLAVGDIQLKLPGAKARKYFDESWLETCASGATRLLAQTCPGDRSKAVKRIAAEVAAKLGVRSRTRWPTAQRRAFERMAPIAGLVKDLDAWTPREKHALARLMRAKAKPREREYIRLLRNASRLQKALTRFCKRHQ